jgi:hypothetical protein
LASQVLAVHEINLAVSCMRLVEAHLDDLVRCVTGGLLARVDRSDPCVPAPVRLCLRA